jgi:cytochrome P450 family 135
MALPPGPRLPKTLQTLRWIARPDSFMRRCRREYGDVFTMRFNEVGDIVFLCDPADIKSAFTADPDVLRAGEANAPTLERILGDHSVLLLDGAPHLRERKLMLPAFHGERMQAYGSLMADIARRDIETWPLHEPFSLQPHMAEVTLNVILRAIFGTTSGPREDELRLRIRRMVEGGRSKLGYIPILREDYGRFSLGRLFSNLMWAVDELLYEEIAEHRADPRLAMREDIMAMFCQAKYEDGEPMSDEAIRDELMTLLLAGHETTATSMAWAFERILRHPEVHERLVSDLRAGDDRYLDAVINESLRLRPILPVVGRHVAKPWSVAGYDIPVGTMVAPCIFLTQRREDIYPEPDRFLPERFLDKKPETYSWLPFGGGTRRCIGASFALFEMRVVLREILLNTTLRAAEPRSETIIRGGITLMPEKGALVVMDERTLAGKEAEPLAA